MLANFYDKITLSMKHRNIIEIIILDSLLAFASSMLIFFLSYPPDSLIKIPEFYIFVCCLSGIIVSLIINIDSVIIFIKKAFFHSVIFGIVFGCMVGFCFSNDSPVWLSFIKSFARGFFFIGFLPASVLFLIGFLIRLVAYLISRSINKSQ